MASQSGIEPPHYPSPGPALPSIAGGPVGNGSGVLSRHGRIRTTRVSAAWVGLIVAAVILVALLIFIAQNSKTVTIHYLGFHGRISLGIAILLAAVLGVLFVAIPGTARIIQLRLALKHHSGGQADA